LGQGTTPAKNLPPTAGSPLKTLWKTPIPGEGVSSPVVSQGRVYLTTAYEGVERHSWDQPVLWASVLLACGVAGLALARVPSACHSFTPRPVWMTVLGVWTIVVLVLTAVVLAKPTWFWHFADPWTGTTVAPAELPWVESLHLRPAIVLVCGSLLLIFTGLIDKNRASAEAPEKSPLLTRWLGIVTLTVTLLSSAFLGLIAWRPDWFFQASQPWLAWLVTGGLTLFALAGSLGCLGERRLGLLPAGLVFALAVWLFHNTPSDEFGNPLSLQNRMTYLVPGLLLAAFNAVRRSEDREQRAEDRKQPQSSVLCFLSSVLCLLVFLRANYLHPQIGLARAVVCLDAESGEVLWTTPVYVAAAEKRHSLNSLATPTPACDGERIYAYFGSGLAALDTGGRLLWLKRDPSFAGFIRYGAGSSVALAGERIIIYRDSEFMGHGDHLEDDIQCQSARRPSALTAYDKRTGDEVWSVAPPFSHDSYMTPLVWTRDERLEVVIATWKTLAGFDANDGALRWTHSYPMQQIVPSLAVHGDCVFVTGGNELPCPILAVRAPSPTRNGAKPAEPKPAETLWFNRTTGGNIASPVCWDGLLFSMSHAGILTCRDAESGQIHWNKRLGRCLASLVAGDGKLYVLDQDGTLHVLAADTIGTELDSLSLLENGSATPALAAGRIFVRTSSSLHCIAS
jgi:outer membrane protein assembly factor BamB